MKAILSVPRSFVRFLRRRWKLLAILVVILAAGAFWMARQNAAKQVAPNFIKPERIKLTKTLEVSGVVDAKEKANLRFAAGGKVVYLGAKEGDTVKKNQTIARIDARDLQKRLQQDLNSYFNERMDFEQGKDDRRDIAPTNRLGRTAQKEQKDLETSVLDVEIRDIAIKNSYLTTPIAGILVGAPTSVAGVNLAATDAFEVVNPESLVFRATVDQADISLIRQGLPVKISLDAYEDDEVNSTISYISYKTVQSTSGTVFIVEMPLAQTYQFPLDHYRIGMNGDADIILAEKDNVLAIPLNATRERDGKVYVDVRTGEKTFAEREIEVGLETDEHVEVVGGLSADEEIVLP